MKSAMTLTALTGAIGLLVYACGSDASRSESSLEGDAASPGATAETAAPAADAPDAESVTLEVEGRSYVLDQIVECPATPGLGLGFQAYSTDPEAPPNLRAGGGFEGDRGRVFVNLEGTRWTGGEGVEGSDLRFDLTDHDTERGRGAFVTVTASGTLVDDSGSRLPFQVTATCAPGGT